MTAELREEIERFLRKAEEDLTVLAKLLSDEDVSDSILGFHAQQAAEKYLKAVLLKKGIVFPRTHDLVALARLLAESGVKLPVDLADFADLTPFAVTLRYDDSEEEVVLGRKSALAFVRKVKKWATSAALTSKPTRKARS